MKRYCSTVYKKLQEELLQCKRSKTCFEREVESCFHIAYRHWNRVREKLTIYEFKTDEEEMEFFIQLKPKFTSEIEYYELLYHAAVFEPSGCDDALHFWNREIGRLKRFEEDNRFFLHCYTDESCKLRPYYFLRRYCENQVHRAKLYDAGTKDFTNGDSLVATFLVLQRYIPYLEEKLAGLYEGGG